MAILERMIIKVALGKMDAMKSQEKAWDALEAKVGGFPQKRRYQAYSGSLGQDCVVIEREWESFTVCEAAYTLLWSSPDIQSVVEADAGIKSEQRVEFYLVME